MKKLLALIILLAGFNNNLYSQWNVEVSDFEVISNPVGYPNFKWYPDGHISVLKDNDEYIMFWAEFESHRSVGSSQFVEEQEQLNPSTSVFGKRGNFDSWDNGGSWLMSVFRNEGDNFIGFFHAEDHWYPHTGNDVAWKSIGVTYSEDKGKTWSTGNQIISSSKPKPDTPEWGGTGDCCVVWDHINNRWMCYFQEHTISMAVSYDPLGAPGTWKKYYYGDFTEDGLGGYQSPLPGLQNTPGGNPSVHWNTYLNKWVMVWHGWQPAEIYVSISADGVNWDSPISIVKSSQNGRAWYPTIIGETDVLAGQIAKIYYADIAPDFSSRIFKSRTISFFDISKTEETLAEIVSHKDGDIVQTESVKIKADIINLSSPILNVEFYSNGNLIGTDQQFPYQIQWAPNENGNYTVEAIFIDENNKEFKSDPVQLKVEFDLSVYDQETPELIISPCPAEEMVSIKNLPAGKKQITIYNMNSAILYEEEEFNDQTLINISKFANGMYIIIVKSDNVSLSEKFIKI